MKIFKNQPQTRNRAAVFGRSRANNSSVAKVSATKDKIKFDFSWVSVASLSITVFAAVLYGAGKAYRQAYLFSFGFNDSLIPWTFQDLVYLGITKQITILLTAPIVGIGAILGLVITLALWFLLLERLAGKRRKAVESIENKSNSIGQKFGDDIIFDFALFLINGLGAVLIIFLLALFFVARAESQGKTDAKTDMAAIAVMGKEPNGDKTRLSYAIVERLVDKRKISEEGYVISCSDSACGLFVPGEGSEASRLVFLNNIISFRYVR